LNPDPGMGAGEPLAYATASIMSFEFVVVTLTEAFRLLALPAAVLGREVFGSNGEVVFAPLIAKAFTSIVLLRVFDTTILSTERTPDDIA
jgi:hypothetical protein